jgi:hypothetical protein
VLTSLREAHSAQLADLKTPAGQPLAALLEEGLAVAAKPADVVAAAIAAKEAVAAQTELPTLIAVDDYNALYARTGYYESVHNFHRRQLAPDELRLVSRQAGLCMHLVCGPGCGLLGRGLGLRRLLCRSLFRGFLPCRHRRPDSTLMLCALWSLAARLQVRAFRVMEQPQPANGVAVGAPTFGQTISGKLRLPRPKGSRFPVPRYSLPEVAAAAQHFVTNVAADGQGEETAVAVVAACAAPFPARAFEVMLHPQAPPPSTTHPAPTYLAACPPCRRPLNPHCFTCLPPGAPAGLPHEEALRRALFLTSGNARELRSFASGLLLPEPTLGLSRGYQAAAAVRRAYNLAQV